MIGNGWLPRDCKSKLHSDINYDIEHGYLRVFDPRLTPEIVEEIDPAADTGGICYPEWLKAKAGSPPEKGGTLDYPRTGAAYAYSTSPPSFSRVSS
jgi:hypothetical protein